MDEELRKIEARMSNGEPFTFMQLHQLSGCDSDTYRLADRALQKWRRKGWISFKRKGHTPVWFLTDIGREKVLHETKVRGGE